MNRAVADNALLLQCHDFSGRVALGCKVVASGIVIALSWYLIVAWRAGVL